jgi:hypothetical protein
VRLQSTEDVLETLGRCALSTFADRVAAIAARFDDVASDAAKLCEPEVQFVHVPRRTLKTEEEIENWIIDVRKQLKAALPNGPIVIR